MRSIRWCQRKGHGACYGERVGWGDEMRDEEITYLIGMRKIPLMIFNVSNTLDGAGGVMGIGRIAARGPFFRSSFICDVIKMEK